MGYNLTIGEFEVEPIPEERIAFVGAKGLDGKELGAPVNSGDNHTNCVSPGYVTWDMFARTVGLYQVFYAPRCAGCQICDAPPLVSTCGRAEWWEPEPGVEFDGLLHRHPGAAELTEYHLKAFEGARDMWARLSEEEKVSRMGAACRGSLAPQKPNSVYSSQGVDYTARRLDWLCWWTKWALGNCKHPTMGNS